MPIHERLYQITELFRSELVALDVRHKLSVPVDNRGVQGMVHETLILKSIQTEKAAHPLHIGCRAGKEVPGASVGFPDGGVFQKNVRPIVGGVESYSQQHQIRAGLFLEPLLQLPKVIGRAKTEVGQGAAGVNEVEGHDFTREFRECNAAATLVEKVEIRHPIPNGQRFDSSYACGMLDRLVHQSEAARGQRIHFEALIGQHLDVFDVRSI